MENKKRLLETNVKKSNKKLKETIKHVKKVTDEEIDSITRLVNMIFIQRSKIRMIYFSINKEEDKGDAEESKQEDEYVEELTPEEQEAKQIEKTALRKLA